MREFPASPMQTAVYAASLDSISNATANTQVSINFGETVDMPLIHKAWKWITQYHSLLRSSFKRPGGGALTLREHEDCEIAWRSLDWSKVPAEEISTKWQQLQLEDAAETIDLTKPPLYRFHTIQLPGNIFHLLWTFHSILLDEESVFIILRDWLKIYELVRRGQELPPSQGALSYAAVIGAIEGADTDTAKKHWKNAFRDFSNWCPLRPLYADRTASAHLLTTTYTELFARDTTAILHQLAASADASIATVLMAAWGLVLARTNIDTDAIFGVYRSCRSLIEHQTTDTVGLFDSLLPIRIKIPEELTCRAWLRELQKEETASIPFLLTDPKEVWTHAYLRNNVPRFDSTFHYLPISINDRLSMEMPEWTRFDARVQKASAVPIRVTLCGGDRLAIAIEYNAHQIPPALARQLFDRLLKVIRFFEENPDSPLSQISITLPHEIENLFNISTTQPRTPSLDLFAIWEERVRQMGDLPAIEKENQVLNFSLIDAHSKQLGAFLHRQSPTLGNIIALAMPPSPEMLISLLGILRAGYTCFPLDTSILPADLDKILTHYRVSAVLTDSKSLESLGNISQPSFAIDHLWSEITASSEVSPHFSPQASDPALFLLQADGKRILITHGILQIALSNAITTYQTKAGDRILCHSLQGSAACIEECLVALFTGATLVIPGKNVKSTRTAFQESVESGRITHLRITSTFWSQWVHYLNELGHPAPSSLRRVLIEAGHLSRPVIEGWKELVKTETDCVVFYSPSGLAGVGIATEGVRAPELSEEGLVCGQPQPGIVAVLSDRHHRLVPPLFPGILLLGTTQHQPIHSLETITFTTDSTSWTLSSTDERARWNEKGQLILISQPHAQLPEDFTWTKLRIVEEALTSHPDLIDAIVRKSLSDGKNLCAWIVLRDSHAQFPPALENHLRDRLPKNWVPSLFGLVTRFNLNAFDQIDTASLPIPEPAFTSKPKPSAPTTITTSLTLPHAPLSPITTLRTGIVDTALYFVHAGRGMVEDYRPVAQALSGGYSVHCLTVPRGRMTSSTTVEEIICHLLPAFRSHVTGKFAVAGIGTGAVFAWELARQLDQQHETDAPFIFFEAPPTGRKDSTNWFQKIRRAMSDNKPAPYSPQGRFAELVAIYQPPVLERKPYFFVSGKPDPEWRRRAPSGIWGQLRLAGTSLLDEPGEIAGALRDVLSPLSREKIASAKSITKEL